MIKEFEKILERIIAGENVKDSELLKYLTLEAIEERLLANKFLAHAYFMSGSVVNLNRASELIKRAWEFSRYSENILGLYIDIHVKKDDLDAVKTAYKRIAIKKADEKKYSEAFKYFNLWQNTFAIHKSLDVYQYDSDIMNAIDRMAEPFIFPSKKKGQSQDVSEKVEKIKIAYLVKGIMEPNSVLVKINSLFAKYHDDTKYEIAFFIPENPEQIAGSDSAKNNIRILQVNGCSVFTAANDLDDFEKLLDISRKIFSFSPHIFVCSAALSFFEHYFISAIKPFEISVCLNQGPAAQFAWHNFDYAISWYYTNLHDCPVSSALVPLEFEMEKSADVIPVDKASLGIPTDSIIILSGGRTQKFQERKFWTELIALLSRNNKLHYIVLGLEIGQVPFITRMADDNVLSRIKFKKWRTDYLSYVAAADIVVDTFPIGGGVFMIDAMTLGKPVLSFHHDYVKINDGSFGSAGDEVLGIDELLVERGDFSDFNEKLWRLVSDDYYRAQLGDKCRKIAADRSNPRRMVSRCENIYKEILEVRKPGEKGNIFRNNENDVKELENTFLRAENYYAWQIAFENGYDENMGNHGRYFYNRFIHEIGYYQEVSKAAKVAEFAPGNAEFIKVAIEMFTDKEFYLIEIAEKNAEYLKQKFKAYHNVSVILNNKKELPLNEIDSAFSFLLCQSVPKSLWMEHLAEVHRILKPGGSYVFQFASHYDRKADDNIVNSVSGSQMYSPEQMLEILKKSGFRAVRITDPIDLSTFNSDIKWYLCIVKKTETLL